jgi:predicted nuclease with TOPRIM domain
MPTFETLISSGVLAGGGGGILVVIALFIRRLVSDTTKNTAKSSAEVDILAMWKMERDTLKKLTEELQSERLSLTSKLSAMEGQLKAVQVQLQTLIEDKKSLMIEVEEYNKKCYGCKNRAGQLENSSLT